MATTITLTPISIDDWKDLAKNENAEEYYPNGLKVSKTDQPMVFPVENTYQVGSAEILALMSNAIAVGTGQTGAAPLYVFCKDGVYALFVDASGEMTYKNARVLAREVCNNARSVTPIDAGVVFTTDRGLMMLSGEQVQEIGAPAEGDVLQYAGADATPQCIAIAKDALTKIAELPSSLCDETDFLTYLKGAIINYNHNMRELMVTNPSKSYSYIMDRDYNWTRRDYTAAQYVNNYPTSYRVTSNGKFYKVDEEGDSQTSLEHKKEADNQIFYLSNVIKLDSIGFKQAYRFVVRGYFESIPYVEWSDLFTFRFPRDKYNDQSNTILVSKDVYDRVSVGGKLRLTDHNWTPYTQRVVNIVSKNENPYRIEIDQAAALGILEVDVEMKNRIPSVGCCVLGSYDGIKFAPLGFNRKSGKFTNIGCLVSHTDVRFYRVILCGQVTGKTSIDYMEMSAGASMLNTKIR